jgi:hypothetical protein
MMLGSTKALLQLASDVGSQSKLALWTEACSAFNLEHANCTSLISLCGESNKILLARGILDVLTGEACGQNWSARVSTFQNDLHFAIHACYPVSTGRAAGCEVASIFGSIRIMLREAEGSADLLTESAVQLYLRAALASEDATSGFKVAQAGLACLLNAVLHLEATQAPLPKATTAVLLSLLGEERPVSILHLAARILYRVCATRADASAELRNRCLATTASEPQSMILQHSFCSYQRH